VKDFCVMAVFTTIHFSQEIDVVFIVDERNRSKHDHVSLRRAADCKLNDLGKTWCEEDASPNVSMVMILSYTAT
jgi:hypothetical protein